MVAQGCDPKQYRNQYEEKLRAAEMEAIQDYIGESDNFVGLHKEVGGEVTCCTNSSAFLARSTCVKGHDAQTLASSLWHPPSQPSNSYYVAQISACDSILAGMESMLGGFQVCGTVCNSAGVFVVAYAINACRDGLMAVAFWQTSGCIVPCHRSGRAGIHQR